MDWHELQKKKADALREIAKEHGAKGTTAMNKYQLVELVAGFLDIAKPHKIVEGAEKAEIKGKIKVLKAERQTALEAGDAAALSAARRKIHRLKRKIRRQASLTH